jgi:hypothetical protein
MAFLCGEILGFCAMIVQSMLPISYPESLSTSGRYRGNIDRCPVSRGRR